MDEALQLFDEGGDVRGSARVLNSLGGVASRQGRYGEAERYCQRGLELCRALGDRGWSAIVLHNLGNYARFQGRTAIARERYEEALAIHREVGQSGGIVTTLLDLGSIAIEDGHLVDAETHIEESLVASRALGLQQWIAYGLWQRGRLCRKRGQLSNARVYFGESLKLASWLGDAFLGISLVGETANLAVASGNLERAVALRGAETALQAGGNIVIAPIFLAEEEEMLARARAVLSEEQFTRFWNQGQGMTLEEALAGALDETGQYVIQTRE